MSNPFDNVPSSADVPETINKKDITALTAAIERFETAVSREETTVKNQEELAGALFEIFLDDDGSMKDFAHTKRFESAMNHATHKLEEAYAKVETSVQSVPTRIEVRLCDEDRNRFDCNLQSWKDVFKHNPIVFICIGVTIGICLFGSLAMCNSASDKKHEYEQRINQLDRWHQDNAEVISFGQFYRENYPKKYREWQTGRWQQGLTYRDSLIRSHSLDRLKHLYEDK